jgi:protein-S-isoprenylcysteine O-methyltransferase Ste14
MSLLNNDRLAQFFSGRRRFQLAWIFAILLIMSAKQYPSVIGILICFIGASLRFSSSGYLRKEAKLAVGGPYSQTRNPLYLGTFVMAVGATIGVGAYLLAVAIGIVFFFNYHYVIKHEEEKLPSYFGDNYLKYCELVPRFWPRLTSPPREELLKINSDPEIYTFDFALAKRNKAFEAYITFVALIVGTGAIVWVKMSLGLLQHSTY